MLNKTRKTGAKRLAKGQRTHIRRLKQAARKEIGANNPQPSPAKPGRAQKNTDQS